MQYIVRLFFLEWELPKGVLDGMKCPNCHSSNIAEILWGLPVDMKAIEKEIKDEKIVLGGCLISGHDPKWQCNKCQTQWGDAEHNDEDKIDSFDYDQGFNLGEVYDQ